ncbi:MAG: ABC-2 family transporter protein [Phycisphaerae bacterium]|jgi:ABC-2 type transport system permease protein
MHARYGQILVRFWKNSLIREMTFRGHFLVNAASELMWVALLLIFINVIFSKTSNVRGWTEHQYLFLAGTHMLVTSFFEALFFGNCWRISELVRTGDLDFVLVRPANAQFLLSFERLDLSPLANVPVAVAICIYALVRQGETVTATKVGLFVLLVAGGVLILYSLLFMFATTSVWLIRQTGVDMLWFYAVSLARYPAEIYKRFAGGVLWFALVFVVPVLMVANLPANVMTRTFKPFMVCYVLAAGVTLLLISSLVFRLALRWYRSASS